MRSRGRSGARSDRTRSAPSRDRSAHHAGGTTVVAVDIGGTFTDIVLQRGSEVSLVLKRPTSSQEPSQAVLAALEELDDIAGGNLVHATTIGTNALLQGPERLSHGVSLVTTQGFRDVIEIGRQNRPSLYDLEFRRPRPLVARRDRYEVPERVTESGRVLVPLRRNSARRLAVSLRRAGARAVAVSLLHSYANPVHERRIAAELRSRVPFVSVSSEVAPEPREFERTSTVVVNAWLMPLVSQYISHLGGGLPKLGIGSASVMASSGGLVSLEEAATRPVQIIESGPAAGVVAAAETARRAGLSSIISFDMGGTTAKVGTVHDGRVGLTAELEVGGDSHHGRRGKGTGYPVRFPFVDLAEVSSGGGTMIRRDPNGTLTVGPESAGSAPGPICYGRGGTVPTLTDANLVTGVLAPTLLGGEMKLDRAAARRGFARMGDPLDVAEQALRLADLEMARALRMVTVERGLDPRHFTLVAFGGGGPQHAARLATELRMSTVLVPRHPGVFSSIGLLLADWRYEARMAFPKDLPRDLEALRRQLRRRFRAGRFSAAVECRYAGQGSELSVPLRTEDRRRVAREFERLHEVTFGFRLTRGVELVTLRLFGERSRPKPSFGFSPSSAGPTGTRTLRWMGRDLPLETFGRDGLARGARIRGPAAIDEYGSTTLVPPSWTATVLPDGLLRLERSSR